jgi:4-cresol dehydrogenase (hydroxylating)
MRVPPKVSEATFADGISEMQSAVGAQWVFTSDPDVDLYRDAYSLLWDEPEERIASAAVAPSTVEEVQAVVRACNARSRSIPSRPAATWAMAARPRLIRAASCST